MLERWFVNKKRLGTYTPSAAELKIEEILKNNCIDYRKEISFPSCRSRRGYNLIFDFVIPSKNLIIEYDGPHHDYDTNTIENDSIKNDFLKHNGFKLLRLNGRHWNKLESSILGKIKSINPPKKKEDHKIKIVKNLIGSNYKPIKNSKPYKTVGKRKFLKPEITIDMYESIYGKSD